jgi:hypothetical protein
MGIRVLLIGLLLSIGQARAQDACDAGFVDIKGNWGQARFSVELAITPEERARGLMYRTELATLHSMLFVYTTPQPLTFWMKNTLIPLDIIFIDETGLIRHIHPNAKTQSLDPIYGGPENQYVLEVNAGLSKRLGLRVGDAVRHPVFGQTAIWACAEK